jgi:colicin import membrane protein
MARKLKTYQTSLGFFDLAIAAPSMKAALEAWGANSNLFHQGVAKEVDDPAVVAATMSSPGIVLRRPIGSNGRFNEHADLPRHLPRDEVKGESEKRSPKGRRPSSLTKIDGKAARQAALAFERQQRQRESDRRKEEAAAAKKRERRELAVTKAQAALAKAQREHDTKASIIEAEGAAIETRSQAEDARWQKQKEKLKIAVRRAQG